MSSLQLPQARVRQLVRHLGLAENFGQQVSHRIRSKYAQRPDAARQMLTRFQALVRTTGEGLRPGDISPPWYLPHPAAVLDRPGHPALASLYIWKNLRHTVTAQEIAQFLPEIIPDRDKAAREIARDPARIEGLIRSNARFRAYMEEKLGGRIQWDPETSGFVLIRRQPWVPGADWQTRIPQRIQRLLERLRAGLERILAQFAPPVGETGTTPVAAKPAPEAPGATPTGTRRGVAGTDGIGNLSGLSLEDRLILLLAQFAQKRLQELEDKVRELQGAGGNTGGKATRAPLGGLAGPAGGSVGKPRATRSNQSETMIQAQIQILQQKFQRTMELLSNMMKAFHDAMSTSIRNIR